MVRLICYRADFSGELTPSMEIEKFDFFGYEQRAQTSVADNLLFDDLHKRGLIQ